MDASCYLALGLALRSRKEKRRRRWMKEWYRRRQTLTHENLLSDLRVSEPNDYRNFLRMDARSFDMLLELVSPLIKKKDTHLRDAIPASQRLSITLRYLATGNSFEDLKFISAISPQSISRIVMETCTAIIQSLKHYIKIPQTEGEWKAIAQGFQEKWNFPNCLGAVDGKHVSIKKPPHSGSYYYNYKNFFSIVLLAVVDHNYEFIMADVGINGRISDGGVLSYTDFGKALNDKSLKIPAPCKLPNSDKKLPFVFVGDDAFPLSENLMKPFSQTGLEREQRVFNYRLSRARRIVENAFGILVSRFGVFQRPINLNPNKVKIIVLACCYLHNFLRKTQENTYMANGSIDMEDVESGNVIQGTWRQNEEATGLQSTYCRHASQSATLVRDNYCYYFNNEGQVPWQTKFF